MIYFSAGEILISVVHSALYGIFFSFFSLAAFVLQDFIINLFKSIKNVFNYTSKIAFIKTAKNKIQTASGAQAFLGIILFTVGYILLSYYSLDASFRFYVLFVSLSAYLLSWLLLKETLIPVFNFIFDRLFFACALVLRMITFPFFKIIMYIKAKMTKNKL